MKHFADYLLGIAFAILAFSPSECPAQSEAAPRPNAFEVASVKPYQTLPNANPFANVFKFRPAPTGLVVMGASLRECIVWAYGLRNDQISAPSWMDTEQYDVNAKTVSKASVADLRIFLQDLLHQRFKMRSHYDQRAATVYTLNVEKNGLKVKLTAQGNDFSSSAGRGGDPASISGSISMKSLADTLSKQLHAPVEDATGVQGCFPIDLKWMPEDRTSAEPAPNVAAAGSIFSALREELGLSLRARKGKERVLVVDYADKLPTEN